MGNLNDWVENRRPVFEEMNKFVSDRPIPMPMVELADMSGAVALDLIATAACPEDVTAYGKRHRMEAFAEMTWQNGYQAGFRAAVEHLRREAAVEERG